MTPPCKILATPLISASMVEFSGAHRFTDEPLTGSNYLGIQLAYGHWPMLCSTVTITAGIIVFRPI